MYNEKIRNFQISMMSNNYLYIQMKVIPLNLIGYDAFDRLFKDLNRITQGQVEKKTIKK